MNELALFAGAGGGILGGKLLGWRTVCAVERDAYASQVLAQRQNDGILEAFPIWSDITTFDGKPWQGIVDVVSGGFPCQDISAAGKGAGIEGERSGMWKEMARIIGEVRPTYAFVENSQMLTTRGLGTVLADLAALGFDAEWGVLSAADVGANHKRERIWILAYSKSNGSRRELRKLHEKDEGQPKSKEQYENKTKQSYDGSKNVNSKQRNIFSHTEHDRDGWGKQFTQGTEKESRNPKRQLADPDMLGCDDRQFEIEPTEARLNAQCNTASSSGDVANANSQHGIRWRKSQQPTSVGWQAWYQFRRRSDAYIPNATKLGLQSCSAHARQPSESIASRSWWGIEPNVGRVADGVAARVDRLKAIGNGQVPLCAATAFELLRGRLV